MKTINHFDIGLAYGREIQYCHDIYSKLNIPFTIYGIEAERTSFKYCSMIYKNLKNIKLFNFAITNKEDSKIKFFLQDDNTNYIKQGNSIYSSKNNVCSNKYQVVKALKFSSFLKENNIILDNSINIIRINIEGAEWDFFSDLDSNNLINSFSIFMGAGKTDIYKVKELVENNIDKKFDNLINKHDLKIYRYSSSKLYKNIILQKLLIEYNEIFSKHINNKDIQFTSIEKNMKIEENSNFELNWKISEDIFNKIGDNIHLVLQRDTYKQTSYHFIFDICQVNKSTNSFIWNVKAGKKHNKKHPFFIALLSPSTFPNYIGWSEPFYIF